MLNFFQSTNLNYMKTVYWIGAVVIVLIILGLIVHSMNPSNPSQGTASNTQVAATTTANPTQGAAPAPANPSASASPAAQHFTVNGNDATADLKTIRVVAGTPVTITFGADAGTTYHGGLDFRSSVVNTGTITPGSTKAVSFTATHSFSFTPYWPATNIAKPYTIDIIVQ